MIGVIRPIRLPDAGVVGAFTPSDPITEHRGSGIERGVSLLRSSGLNVRFSRNAFGCVGHVSAAAETRAADMADLATDNRIHALMATCGGKCSNAVIVHLDYDLLLRARKPVTGFSDAGVILNAITAQTGLVTFYGPNVLSKLHETTHYALGSLRKPQSHELRESAHAIMLAPGTVEGRLIGGNLSTFTISIAGTEFEPRFPQTILFWEAGTRDWRLIDQYLTALEIRGVMSRICGMLIGKIGESAELHPAEQSFLRDRLKRFRIPVLWMPTFGHGDAENPIWPIGGLVRLDATFAKVICLEPFVDPR